MHGLESRLFAPVAVANYPSLLQKRRALPRVDNGELLLFRWKLKRTRDFYPVAALFPIGPRGGGWVSGGQRRSRWRATARRTVPVHERRCPTGGRSDQVHVPSLVRPVLELVGCDRWRKLRTSFDLVTQGGPFVVRQKKSGDFAISCSKCGWRGSGKRSATVMLQRLVGDVARHDCPPSA